MTNIEAIHRLEELWAQAGETRDWFKMSKMREIAVNFAKQLDSGHSPEANPTIALAAKLNELDAARYRRSNAIQGGQMHVSQLIDRLQAMLAQHGNLRVTVPSKEGGHVAVGAVEYSHCDRSPAVPDGWDVIRILEAE